MLMALFKRVALLATGAVYFLVFFGGLVRVSGAGLGCPDWPRCFGRWIPPLSVDQLPAGIDPAQFNFTLAWIEYVNRLFGVAVGLLVLTVAILAIRHYRGEPSILWPSIAAALLVAFEGWQGSVVVASELEPIVVTVHMLLAFLIAGLLVWVTFRAYAGDETPSTARDQASRLPAWVLALWIVTIVQVVVGTAVRGGLEYAAAQYPLLSDTRLLARVGPVGILHAIAGALVAIASCVAGFVIAIRRPRSGMAVQGAWTLAFLGALQLVVGSLMGAVGFHPVLRLLHLWTAALTAGILLVTYLSLRTGLPTTDAADRRPRLLGLVTAALVALALVTALVTGRADASRRALPELGQVPDFTFTAQTGEAWGKVQMQGKVGVVYFGFASCQGPCPIITANLAELYRLYAGFDHVQFVEFSVDPARDTLEALRAYAQSLGVNDGRWVFLRAPVEDVARLSEKGFMLAADNLPGGHSTRVVLVDETGNIRGYYDGQNRESIAALAGHIRALVRHED
jgi:cytochrome c oxidase assembly protein subunit 15